MCTNNTILHRYISFDSKFSVLIETNVIFDVNRAKNEYFFINTVKERTEESFGQKKGRHFFNWFWAEKMMS